jgi:hypothetical protein
MSINITDIANIKPIVIQTVIHIMIKKRPYNEQVRLCPKI